MLNQREALKNVRTFPQLIKFLRDELDWPIESEDFEELTFDYTPEELGIDSASAAKIQEIKRLRPLSAGQPWGIFFVKFEPRRLPVVALRRVLSRVVFKKRASANSADRAAWQADDLLFISNYGDGTERQISFAHFSQAGEKSDLPTLKVLGWDNRDTALHLDDVADTLHQRLAWPEDNDDAKSWREKWRSAFTLRNLEVITTSKDLAGRLADLARAIHDRIRTVLAIETENGPVTKLMKAFQQALIHDLSPDDFADTYAQTIAYGLLSARVANPTHDTADAVAMHIPVTNPFLKELMETFLHLGGRKRKERGGNGIDFDELGVSEVVELLDAANMEAVVRDFGDRNRDEDPVIHFYELFLKEYDAKKRMQRGVFYTPQPVVYYIVQSVHELLQTEFGLEDGLASTATWGEMAAKHAGLKIPDGVGPGDPFVVILDPATGTATFLVEVIDVIYLTLAAKWKQQRLTDAQQRGAWNEYVPKHLLPRLHGFELMMAPYAIAHMKIGLKLYETGYRFGSEERARIYLTNSLEPPSDDKQQHEFEALAPALAHEAQAVNAVKRRQRFTVVIGNPPYSGHSANQGPWISDLLHSPLPDGSHGYFEVDGAPLDERNPKWLNDDYVKFIRYGQLCISHSLRGILGLITNHGYFDNPTFRGMRQSLLQSFSKGYVVDLHGNVKKLSAGSGDQNVFDIQQGVGIGVWVRSFAAATSTSIFHAEMTGSRSTKYDRLLAETVLSTGHDSVRPVPPFYLFVPQSAMLHDEFRAYTSLIDVFPINTMGVTTGRDQLCVSFTVQESLAKMTNFTSGVSELELAARYGLSNKSGWNIAKARRAVRSAEISRTRCCAFAYRPFDIRTLYLDAAIVGRPRLEVMKNMMERGSLGLCTTRQVNGEFRHVFCTRFPANDCVVSLGSGERAYLFPLFLWGDRDGLLAHPEQQANLAPRCLEVLGKGFRRHPEDIFHYVYAVLHSPGYRSRYAEFLKIEFPRLPLLTAEMELFRKLAALGGELVALHLLESPKLDNLATTYTGPEGQEVDKISHARDTVWLDKAQKRGFRGVPEPVWNFHIGGYQVCEKWLKDRKGRTLSKDDIAHYQKIIVALTETIRLMTEIDKVIDVHGGWPGAFGPHAS